MGSPDFFIGRIFNDSRIKISQFQIAAKVCFMELALGQFTQGKGLITPVMI